MNEHIIDTLFELLGAYKVEVPILQRDYAQGRQDAHTSMVRANLLADMKAAIQGKTQPLDLNFVYGKVVEDKFIPIDGQQRLTTLFLLHLYAFADDDSKTDLLHKFSYETRTSSRNFLEKLTDNRSAVFASNLPPTQEIEDLEWFISGWNYDPTIRSALTMLDAIKATFCDVENLAHCLSNQEFEPIIFKFLEMKDLGMEDSLYIKLNARGKPLTLLENFKARFIGRLQKLQLPIMTEFEQRFDREWTDMFWAKGNVDFDQTYLAFFGVLLMNKGIVADDEIWSNTFHYENLDAELYEATFYTLQFMCENPDNRQVHDLVFRALATGRTFQERVLFHAVSTYLYASKGVDTGSFGQWLRIIKNLTLNSVIDQTELYRRAIDGIDGIAKRWDTLLDYFAKGGGITGFLQQQIKEEHEKAGIIVHDAAFAERIYQAEQHAYFSGQIRAGLHYAKRADGNCDKDAFSRYWEKIALLFEPGKPKYGNLLRQTLLTLGDYTLPVSAYRTLCIDDPKEASSTPSMKRLFSNHGELVKQLLDALSPEKDIEGQLARMVEQSSVPKSDWRHCFIRCPALFADMQAAHLRLRNVEGEIILVPGKFANGYNYEIFTSTLYHELERAYPEATLWSKIGACGDRHLRVKDLYVRFGDGHFIIKAEDKEIVFETETDDPLTEATEYIKGRIVP